MTAMGLKRFSKKSPCYYCGARLATALKEHAPPKMMFIPFECDRITVPSCEEHNNNKSHKDQAIIAMLLMAIHQMTEHKLNTVDLPQNVMKALSRAKADLCQAKNLVTLRNMFNARSDEDDFQWIFPYLDGRVNIIEWMRQLTAAIVWSVTGRPWDGEWQWGPLLTTFSPDYLPLDQPLDFQALNNFKNRSELYAMLIELFGSDGFTLFKKMDQLNILELYGFFHEQILIEPVKSVISPWWRGWSAVPRRYPSEIYYFNFNFTRSYNRSGQTPVTFKHVFYTRIRWYVSFQCSDACAEALTERAIEFASYPPPFVV